MDTFGFHMLLLFLSLILLMPYLPAFPGQKLCTLLAAAVRQCIRPSSSIHTIPVNSTIRLLSEIHGKQI